VCVFDQQIMCVSEWLMMPALSLRFETRKSSRSAGTGACACPKEENQVRVCFGVVLKWQEKVRVCVL